MSQNLLKFDMPMTIINLVVMGTAGVNWRMLNAERDYSMLDQRKYIQA